MVTGVGADRLRDNMEKGMQSALVAGWYHTKFLKLPSHVANTKGCWRMSDALRACWSR